MAKPLAPSDEGAGFLRRKKTGGEKNGSLSNIVSPSVSLAADSSLPPLCRLTATSLLAEESLALVTPVRRRACESATARSAALSAEKGGLWFQHHKLRTTKQKNPHRQKRWGWGRIIRTCISRCSACSPRGSPRCYRPQSGYSGGCRSGYCSAR